MDNKMMISIMLAMLIAVAIRTFLFRQMHHR